MTISNEPILVLGATGQQGGAVARALHADGWQVRALVRDPGGEKALALRNEGIATVAGDLSDAVSLRAAMAGAYGVFSVQPSSGQGAVYGVSDEDEIRYGKAVADIALDAGVGHLVYSSANAAGATATGMGHFDTKSEIETYVRGLSLPVTIVRPSAFMEILTLPGMGLDQRRFSFFMRSDQPMQFIAVEDIGRIVAAIFADPGDYASRTLEIAGDAVTGSQLALKLSRAAGFPIEYSRFPDSLLEENPFLAKLAELVDHGRLAGNADLTALRAQFPGLLTMDDWLAGSGRRPLLTAIEADGQEVSLR